MMANGMKQYQIVIGILPAQELWDNMMHMPTRFVGNSLLAMGTDPFLSLIERFKFSASLNFLPHAPLSSHFKIGLIDRIIGIGLSFDGNMTFDLNFSWHIESMDLPLIIIIK